MGTSTNTMLWVALVASAVIYAVVATIMELPGSDPELGEWLALILGGVATSAAIVTLAIRNRMLVEPLRSGSLDLTTPEGRAKAFNPFLLCLILSEVVSIFGLMLAILSGDPSFALLFSAAAVLLLVVHRPMAPALNPPPSLQAQMHNPDAFG